MIAQDADATDAMTMKKCPVCGVSVKLENLKKHVGRQHPREEVDLGPLTSKRGLLEAKGEERSARRRAGRKAVGLVSLTAVIVVIILIFSFTRTGEVRPSTGNGVGQAAPDFTVQTTDGGYVALSSYRGTPVLLAFIDIDGAPCQAECEILASVHANYVSLVRFFSIDVDMIAPPDTTQKVNDFRTDKNATWPFALDPGKAVVNLYGITTRPCVFVIDADGIIRSRFVGRAPSGYADYANALEAVL